MSIGSRNDAQTHALTLVLGGAASGKSLWAERLVLAQEGTPVYVATARAEDQETREKIEAHAARRTGRWQLIEEPLDLASTCAEASPDHVLLIDCATMWLTNLMMAEREWDAPLAGWIEAMAESGARVVVVSNDVGGGIVPGNPLARRFQQAQGLVNQRLAEAAGRVVLVTAGLPQELK